MTNERELERLLDQWLGDGPEETPDRVIDTVADRIARQPQQPAWRLDWRPSTMTSFARIGAALAAVVVIAIAGFMLVPRNASVPAAPPSPTPTPTASPVAETPSTGTDGGATGCYDGTTGCAGPLAAGNHASAAFSIPFTFQTPDGWINGRDIPRTYEMETNSGLAYPIEVLAKIAIADPVGCVRSPKSGVGSSVQDIVNYVRSLPALVTTEPVPADVGGYHGQTIDFTVGSSWKQFCPVLDPTNPYVPMLTDTGAPPERLIGYTTDERVRWTVLDVGGQTVIVEIVGPPAQSQFDSAVAADQQIIDSFKFTPGS